MPPGRGIINQLVQQVTQASLATEILYSFVIITCSLMIYFGTKELYELSSHKGIKYFRKAFLFFGLAYFFRIFIKTISFYFNVQGIFSISPKLLNPFFSQITLILFMYFSSMAIFYLLYSVLWKKLKNKNGIYLFHIISLIIAIFSVLSKNSFSYLGLNIFLFVIVLIIVFVSYSNSTKKDNNLYAIYLLLSFFWIINIIDILIPKFLQIFQLLAYIISAGIFLLMLYKVLKKVGSN